MLALLLVLFVAVAQDPPPSRFETTVRSADGSHVATFARLVDDPRPARRNLWQLTVSEDRGTRGLRRVWSIVGPEPDPDSVYLLADDGSAVCRVDPRFDAQATLVEVWRRGRRAGAFDAKALALRLDGEELRADEPRWIEPAVDTLRLRALRYGTSSERTLLDLLALDRGLRTIDLSNGQIAISADASQAGVQALPPVPTDLDTKLEQVYVRSWSAPEEVAGNLGFEVRVRGSFPSAGWRIVGFDVDLEPGDPGAVEDGLAEEPPLLAVTPYAARLEGAAAQVITHFDTVCTLVVPEAGRYRLELRGIDPPDDPRPLEVLPTALYVSVAQSGGLAGVRREIVVRRDGRLSVDGRVSLLGTEVFTELAQRLAALPPEPRDERSAGNDLFRYDLAWVVEGRVVRATFDEGTLIDPWRAVVETLLELARAGGRDQRKPLQIDASKSSLLVRTGSAGLLKVLGHEHTIDVPVFSGEVDAEPDAIDRATLVLVVDAPSLTVIETKNDVDRSTIEKNMHADVLSSSRYGSIVFRSTRVDAKDLGEERFETVIHGDLTLCGITRPARVAALVEFLPDGLRARGSGSLKLSTFGLKPPKALGGTVNVADKVELRFDVVAARSTR